ncbi:hypothetical protein MASR2M117_26260 [Paludibacter sp.]
MTLLKDIVQIEKGRKYNLLEENRQGAIRVFQANDFRNEDKPLYTLESDGVFAEEDDIMLVWDGSVGQMGFGRSGYVGSTMVKLKVKNKKLFSPYFIYRFLQTKSEYLKRKATGATIMHINRKSLEQLEIPDMNLNDQLHIANILSKAAYLISQRKESIRLLDEFLKSTFLEIFGDPVRNEKKWNKVVLGDVCKKIGSGATPKGGKESYHKEGVSLVRSLNVHNDEFIYKNLAFIDDNQAHELKNVIIEKSDVLLNITGASVARCCIVPKDILPARVNQHVSILRPNSSFLKPIFLSRMFTSINYQLKLIKDAKSKGATREAITKEEIEQMRVIAPPLELQTRFAQIVEKTEVLKTQYQQSLQEFEDLYGSLSQKAFRGELVSKKSEAKVITLSPETKVVQPELNKQQAFLRKLMLASHIINELCEESTFGHTKLMKLLYLSEQVGGMALQTNYKKFAAGPFDGKTLTLIDKEFEKNKWFAIHKNTFSVNGQQREATVYKKTDKSLLYKKHFDNYFESEAETINKIIELFRKEKTQMAEIVATLYFAWKELLTANTIISEDSLVKGFYQFHKEKRKFTKEQILLGYEYMQSNKLYPQ